MNKSELSGNRMIVMGRVGLDIYAEPAGANLVDAEFYQPVLGGSSGNIAAGLARMGNAVTMLSKLTEDALGRRVRKEMKSYGISDKYVSSETGDARTSIHFAENRHAVEVVLYRNGAADFELTPDDVSQVNWADFDALIVTGTALARQPSRDAVFHAFACAHQAGVRRAIDLDYRAPTWSSAEEAGAIYKDASQACDIVIGNDDEFGVMAGGKEAGLRLAQEMGQDKLVIYKMGAEGAIAIDHGQETKHGIFPVDALKPIGAGDAFMAGFMTQLGAQGALDAAMDYGAANAAIVVSGKGCAPAMATRAEVDEFLKSRRA